MRRKYLFYRVGLSIGIFSTLQYLEFFFFTASALFENRLQRPALFVPPEYLAVNACGG